MGLEGRVALVTGGSRGIGRAIAEALGDDGAAVAVNYRKDEAAAAEVVARIEGKGGRARAYQASVAVLDEVQEMVGRVVADFGHVDILINNAGISNRGSLVASTTLDDLERVMDTVALGSHHASQAVLPSMREQPTRRHHHDLESVGVEHRPATAVPTTWPRPRRRRSPSPSPRRRRATGSASTSWCRAWPTPTSAAASPRAWG